MDSIAGATTASAAASLSARPHGASDAAPSDEAKLRARTAMLAGPILPTLMRLALPTIAVLVAQTAVNVAETYYVAFLGSDALVGVALVFPVWMLMTMMAAGGVGSGVASSIARAAGAGRHEDADALVFHALLIAVVFGLAFSVGVLAFGGRLFRALGGSGPALDAALLYARFIFLAALPIWIMPASPRATGPVRPASPSRSALSSAANSSGLSIRAGSAAPAACSRSHDSVTSVTRWLAALARAAW